MIKVARVLLSAAAIVAVLAYNAAAQDKPNPNAGKKDQPPASAPEKAADKDPKNPTQATEKPADRPANRDASRDPQRSADRPRDDRSRDTSRDTQRSTDRNRDTSRDPQRSADRPRDDRSRDTSRDAQRSTDRSRDTSRDTERSTDRSRDTSRDSSRDTQRSSDQSRQSEKQVSASDLGFSFSDESSDDGLKISKISSNTLATKAKFKEGDIIVSVNDRRVKSQRDFISFIHVAPRERVTVIVLRDDREVTVYLEPEVIQEYIVTSSGAWLGVDLYDKFSRAAVVLKVHPGSPAERAGLRGDDLIIAVEGTEIRSPEHLGEVIGSMSPGTQVEIEIERNRREQVVDATLGRKENVAQRTEVRQRATILPR